MNLRHKALKKGEIDILYRRNYILQNCLFSTRKQICMSIMYEIFSNKQLKRGKMVSKWS